MAYVAPSKSIFAIIREFFVPKGRAIGPSPRTEQYMKITPTLIGMRSLKTELMEGRSQLMDGDGMPQAKRASESVPFSTRFTLLVFSVRLKFTESAAGLDALRKELKLLKNDATKANLTSVVATLQTMQTTIEKKLNPNLHVPSAGGSGFRY